MRKTIQEGIVDGRFRVGGAENLRVVDASIIPVIPDGGIQPQVYMMAEKVMISALVIV